ncbi:MAG: hypothetical protein EA397_10260 [Deltaproteobacteria bacterium]|nr:MAG: hypothetical protein EA397_10260 [Deltaproteobacteria bacterium]
MFRSLVPLCALAASAVSLCSCNPWDGEEQLGLRHQFRTITTGGDGYATARLPREEFSFTKFLLAARATDGEHTVYVDRVLDEEGTPLRRFLSDLEVNEWRTGAVADQALNHLNWPISDAEPEIRGEEIRVMLGAVDASRNLAPSVQLRLDVLQSDDSNFTSGTLGVNLIFAGDIADDDEMVDAFEEAGERLRAIFDPIELEIELSTSTWPEGTLPRPGFGAPQTWTDLTESTDNLAIDVVVVYEIAGASSDILGAAGSIPGGLLSSEKSGIILSATANAGPDLRFSDPEIDLLAATLGHELGHMVGLFHPVELSYDRWDALEDTPRCTSASTCQNLLGSNLMYPAALCSVNGCLTQHDITPNQASLIHRYTGVY